MIDTDLCAKTASWAVVAFGAFTILLCFVVASNGSGILCGALMGMAFVVFVGAMFLIQIKKIALSVRKLEKELSPK